MRRTPFDSYAAEMSAVGGRVLRTWPTSFGSLAAAEYREVPFVLGVAPALGIEHHVVVPFALRSSVLLGLHEGHPSWFAGQDADLARWLVGAPALAALGDRLSWRTVVAPGAPPLLLDWVLQLRPLPGGRGHLVLRAGDYGGRTGVTELLGTIEWMASVVPRADHPERAFLAVPVFAVDAGAALGLGPAPAAAAPAEVHFVPPSGRASARDAERLVDALAAASGGASEDEISRRVNEAGRLFLRGKTDEYIAIWMTILRDAPDAETRGLALYSIGSGHYAKRDWAQAIHWYEQAQAAGYDPAQVAEDLASARKKLR